MSYVNDLHLDFKFGMVTVPWLGLVSFIPSVILSFSDTFKPSLRLKQPKAMMNETAPAGVLATCR